MRARRGMTLMELLVATSITGMTTAAGYAAFASVIDHRRALRESTARAERAAALRTTLDGWLAAGRVQEFVCDECLEERHSDHDLEDLEQRCESLR